MSGSASVSQSGSVEMILEAADRIYKSVVSNHPDRAQTTPKARDNSVISSDNTLTGKTATRVHLNPDAEAEGTSRPREAATGPREKARHPRREPVLMNEYGFLGSLSSKLLNSPQNLAVILTRKLLPSGRNKW
jgi:hypothetical protein